MRETWERMDDKADVTYITFRFRATDLHVELSVKLTGLVNMYWVADMFIVFCTQYLLFMNAAEQSEGRSPRWNAAIK